MRTSRKKAIDKKLKKGELTEEEAAKAKAEIDAPEAQAPAVVAVTTEQLLAEIRDLLKEKNEKSDVSEENKKS